LVYSINNDSVTYADSSIRKKSISTNLFLKKWSGVIIVIEPTEFSGETDYSEKRKDEIVRSSILPSVILVFTLTTILGIIINNPFTLYSYGIKPILLLVTHIAGLTFSLLLFGKELNLRTKLTDKLCHIASNIDCDAITNSSVSKVFGLITWADIGVVFFSGGLLALFLFPIGNSIGLLTLLSIAAIPYSIFSVLFQWLKLKKWCLLCLSVQLVLITEFLLLVLHFNTIDLTFPILFQVSLLFSIVFLFLLIMKLLFVSEKAKEKDRVELLKIKRDPAIFIHKLKLENKINIPYNKTGLFFGNLKSEAHITVFISLTCSSCAKKIITIRNLINAHINARIQVVFPSASFGISSDLMKILLILSRSGKDSMAMNLLTNWYNNNDIHEPEPIKLCYSPVTDEEFTTMIQYHSTLFSLGDRKVPSIYINGFALPNIYSLEDIFFHIQEFDKLQIENNVEA